MTPTSYEPNNTHQTLSTLVIISISLIFGTCLLATVMMVLVQLVIGHAVLVNIIPVKLLGLPAATTFSVMALVGSICLASTIPGFMANSLIDRAGREISRIPEWNPFDLEKDEAQQRIDLFGKHFGGLILQSFTSRHIVRMGLLEITGMIGCLTYLMEAHWVSILVTAIDVLIMVFLLPNKRKLAQWIDQQIPRLSKANERVTNHLSEWNQPR